MNKVIITDIYGKAKNGYIILYNTQQM